MSVTISPTDVPLTLKISALMAPNSRGRFGLSLLWLLSLPNGARSSNTCIWSPERQLSRLPGYPEGTTATHYLTLEAAKRACDEVV
eukprot:1340164-Amorphochlora_amoeboformis.AAC.1